MQIQGFKQLPVIRGNDVDIYFEYSDELIFVHLPEVRSLTRRSLDELYFLISEWGPFLKSVGYPAVFGIVPYNKKSTLKLADRLGFVKHAIKDSHVIVRLDLGEI